VIVNVPLPPRPNSVSLCSSHVLPSVQRHPCERSVPSANSVGGVNVPGSYGAMEAQWVVSTDELPVIICISITLVPLIVRTWPMPIVC
jgi:hypothetical protein